MATADHTNLNSKDLLVLLLYLPGHREETCQPISGRTRLMKMVFLFEQELWRKFKFDKQIAQSDLPNFEAYDYGPFAKAVLDDVEFLKGLGFIETAVETDEQEARDELTAYSGWTKKNSTSEQVDGGNEYIPERFKLSHIGKGFAEEKLLPRLSQNQKDALAKFKAASTKTPLRQILKYVYEKYPSYGDKSKIKEQFVS